MNVEYDKEADAAYIAFSAVEEGSVKKTVRIKEDILLDFDKEDKLVGVEVLRASKHLAKEVIQAA